MPSEKGLDYATGLDGNAPKTLLAALLIFFRDVPAGPPFGSDSQKSKGLRELLCELRPILSKMARARSTINLETEWWFSIRPVLLGTDGWLNGRLLSANLRPLGIDFPKQPKARVRAVARFRAADEPTVATHALALYRAPALFLQIATEFATIASMFSPEQSIRPGAEDKLAALRRLDKSRAWNSLDDQLYCTICKNVISGRQIEVVGGTNGLRALHLKCSTPGCFSTPADWILSVKSDTVREINILFRDNGA